MSTRGDSPRQLQLFELHSPSEPLTEAGKHYRFDYGRGWVEVETTDCTEWHMEQRAMRKKRDPCEALREELAEERAESWALWEFVHRYDEWVISEENRGGPLFDAMLEMRGNLDQPKPRGVRG